MPDHWPHAGNVPRYEQDLFVVAAENLVTEIKQAACYVDPHEREVPLQRSSKPAANGERLWPVDEDLFGDLGAEAGEGSKYLQAASHHYEKRNRVHPVAESNNERVLVNTFRDLVRFRVLDCQ